MGGAAGCHIERRREPDRAFVAETSSVSSEFANRENRDL